MVDTFSYSHVVDISLPLNEKTVIYPGVPKMLFESTRSEATGSLLTKITIASHTGTHIDAPSHVFSDGEHLDAFPLSYFVGPTRVIDCTKSVEKISVDDVKSANPQKGERILLRTSNSERGLDEFFPDFIYLAPDAATYLAEKEVKLVGIDSWSIKQKGSPDNTPHTALLSKGIPIVEGLDLSHITGGEYFLIVLPLRFTERDGSPARAILLVP